MFIIISTFLVNDCYVTIFLDASIDYSFVSTDFVPFLRTRPSAMSVYYKIEVANGQTVYLNNVVRVCTCFQRSRVPDRSHSFWNG